MALWKQILGISAGEVLRMGVSTPEIDYYIINNDLKSVPNMYFEWPHGLYGQAQPLGLLLQEGIGTELDPSLALGRTATRERPAP